MQNVSGMNGVAGRPAVKVVDTGEHNFDKEANLPKQETQNVTVLEISDRKEIAQSNFVARTIWTVESYFTNSINIQNG